MINGPIIYYFAKFIACCGEIINVNQLIISVRLFRCHHRERFRFIAEKYLAPPLSRFIQLRDTTPRGRQQECRYCGTSLRFEIARLYFKIRATSSGCHWHLCPPPRGYVKRLEVGQRLHKNDVGRFLFSKFEIDCGVVVVMVRTLATV